MTTQTASVRLKGRIEFPYHSLRNISGPDDTKNGRRVYTGHAPTRAFLPLPEDENVRGYLVTAEGKKRQRLSDVHRQIRETLQKRPEDFSILNSGIVIVARGVEVDEKRKVAILQGPSIINGSQTKGELGYYLDYCKEAELLPHDVYVTFELVVTDDDDLIAEISIARNFQNDVAKLSIAGRRKQLDELENILQKNMPNLKLRKSETERSEDYTDTEKLLQVITALIPADLWPKEKERHDPKKVYTYSMKSKCLREFQELHRKAHDKEDGGHAGAKKLYKFYLDIAPTALKLYKKWKRHQGFIGTGIRAIERKNGKVTDVPDGIIFPIIASLSAFSRKIDGQWDVAPPPSFNDDEIIQAAKAQYINVAHHNPWNMGKSAAVYSSLYQITSIYRRLTEEGKLVA